MCLWVVLLRLKPRPHLVSCPSGLSQSPPPTHTVPSWARVPHLPTHQLLEGPVGLISTAGPVLGLARGGHSVPMGSPKLWPRGRPRGLSCRWCALPAESSAPPLSLPAHSCALRPGESEALPHLPLGPSPSFPLDSCSSPCPCIHWAGPSPQLENL